MSNETVSATATISASAETVFAVLADPSSHAAIDGTGWVREPRDQEHLIEAGQVFRMGMYHDNHPDGSYEMANRILTFDPPRTISWEPGQYADNGDLDCGGWIWRYDLTPVNPSETEVTLTYDWSAVPATLREHIQFPPFAPDHLQNSLSHLAEITALTI